MKHLRWLGLGVLFFCATHGGPIDGDPAPGRSPGPPSSSTTPTTTTNANGGDPTVAAAWKKASPMRRPVNFHGATAAISTSLFRRAPSSSEPTSATSSAERQQQRSRCRAASLYVDPSTTHINQVDPPPASYSIRTTSSSSSSSTSFASTATSPSNVAAFASSTGSAGPAAARFDTPPMRLNVLHDLFDTQTGLTNQIIYTIQLSMIPGAISDFFLETTVEQEAAGTFVDADIVDVAAFVRRNTSEHSSSSSSSDSSSSSSSTTTESSNLNGGSDLDASAFDEPERWREMVELLYPARNGRREDNEVFSWLDDTEDEDEDEEGGDREPLSDSKRRSGSGGRLAGSATDEWRRLCTFCVCPNVWTESAVLGVRREMKWFVDLPNRHNKTVKFRLMYRKVTSSAVFETVYIHHLLEDCNLTLLHPSASLDFTHLPLYNNYENCTVFFPSQQRQPRRQHRRPLTNDYPRLRQAKEPQAMPPPSAGLLVHLTRLNVPCIGGGSLTLIGNTAFTTSSPSNGTRPRRLCGKLEELSESERVHYARLDATSAIRLERHPTFRLHYRLVDYCYNVTFTGRNASYHLRPGNSLNCTFNVHLPYGNRIELNVATNWRGNGETGPNDPIDGDPDDVDAEFLDLNVRQQESALDTTARCPASAIMIELIDPRSRHQWLHCVQAFERPRRFNVVSSANTLVINVWRHGRSLGSADDQRDAELASSTAPANQDEDVEDASTLASVYFEYVALPERKFESQCAFGWVAVQQLCVTAVEVAAPWSDAEKECKKRGGNLAVVRSEREQRRIDLMLVNSPGYKDNAAYWIGATDSASEGDFRWSSGYPFTYANWFPGYAEHDHYNRQPNDDGLSAQDCVEMRRYFQTPAGGQHAAGYRPLNDTKLLTYMWNDRDCNAKNFFLCERPMSDALSEKFNWTNDCNRTIQLTKDRPKASLWSPNFPFEYPDNTNCFTVIRAPEGYTIILEFEEFVLEKEPECSYDYLEIVDTIADSSHATSTASSSKLTDLYRKYLQQQRYERSAINRTWSTERIYRHFLDVYQSVRSVVLRIPQTNADTNEFLAAKALPHRICGDWNSKLKLLRYTSAGSLLGLHFSSDYSHHASGFKAKVSIKNVTSACADDRLVPYNGTCYLFVSYPEVDWSTAQSVCRGIGAYLASVMTVDEQRFLVENIRGQIDYTSQTIYWVGAQRNANAEFEWADGANMTFRGWLPGEETAIAERVPAVPTCLALKWKMSPTPMLPSSIYWTAEPCKKYGGYVCKTKPKRSQESYVENRTISGLEGRLTSPGYPNTYPLNVDYWVKLVGPIGSRLIIQFQSLDLEHQDECLYDYVSVQETRPPATSNSFDRTRTESKSNTNRYQSTYSADDRLANFVRDDAGNDDSGQTTDYTTHDLHAKSWFHHDLQRVNRMKRDLLLRRSNRDWYDQTPVTELFLRREIKLLQTLRQSLVAPSAMRRRRRRKRYTTYNQQLAIQPDETASFSMRTGTSNEPTFQPYVRWCGAHQTNMTRYDYVSAENEALLHFHSDFSMSYAGFSAIWTAVDVTGCPRQQLTAAAGTFASPNYPHFLLNHLDCAFELLAASGQRVWLEFLDFEVLHDSLVEVDLGAGVFIPFRRAKQLNDGVFVSVAAKIVVRLRTGALPRGRGFRATYKTLLVVNEEYNLNLPNVSYGSFYHLNYPQPLPSHVNFTQHLTAPMGYVIFLEIYGVGFSDRKCPGNASLEIFDNYADTNGTVWTLCTLQPIAATLTRFRNDDYQRQQVQPDNQRMMAANGPSPVHITSYLNTLHIRQTTGDGLMGVRLNATVRTIADLNYKYKLASSSDDVESCDPNPCQFGGKCVSLADGNRCQCTGHYTGRFCGLGMCEVDPCLFGKCILTNTGFKCKCHQGYVGRTCERKQQPCASNPCEGRGECFNRNGGFFCRCHAWWEGQRCEKKMNRIPYKPLSDRMLQEPFWLGLITVFVVLAFIGLVWCAKRHFPEKIEKLLTEEAERNRPPGMMGSHHHHHQSLREQLQFTNSATQSTVTTPGTHKTILGRLGIRKPSIISISSPQPPGGATARTFSLDDLLRPPPRRSPSPRKKRNNSTPTKTNAVEKTQILQHLIAPAATQNRDKVIDLKELINISAKRPVDLGASMKETNLSESSELVSLTNDSKLEKKVTFARLLNKVSAEMSSGSENNNSALDLLAEPATHRRASSMPPSPCDLEMRSPHSRSSTQSSDSMSSSEAMLPTLDARLGVTGTRYARPKVSSADSILTMFKTFATANTQSKTMIISPSSSIATSSSPHDDHVGDDDSSTSSLHTPASFAIGGLGLSASGATGDCPSVYFRQNAFEVPALDLLKSENNQNASCSNSSSNSSMNYLQPPGHSGMGGGQQLLDLPSNINQCLSPIRELPTPMPSPALTPVMNRPHILFSRFYSAAANAKRKNEANKHAAAGGGSDEDDDDEDEDDDEDDHIRIESDNRAHISFRTDPATSQDKSGFPNRDSLHKVRTTIEHPVVPSIQITHEDDRVTTTTPPQQLLLPVPQLQLQPSTPSPPQQNNTNNNNNNNAQSPSRPKQLIIPKLVVEQSSPIAERLPVLYLGSPPPQRQSVGETNFYAATPQQRKLLKQIDKPSSLDLLCIPPTITITTNMSDSSDNDLNLMLPGGADGNRASADSRHHLKVPTAGMCYLSPFSMCSRNDRTISESNLSSSGYSSMASPGPSRCGSNNPLCPNEMEDPGKTQQRRQMVMTMRRKRTKRWHDDESGDGWWWMMMDGWRRAGEISTSSGEGIMNGGICDNSSTGSSGSCLPMHHPLMTIRFAAGARPNASSKDRSSGTGEGSSASGSGGTTKQQRLRLRSCDSETLSDDILLESNDEGIETDHLDDRIDEALVVGTAEIGLANAIPIVMLPMREDAQQPSAALMHQLQLPSIAVIGSDTDKAASPVSSRSESPLSDRNNGMKRFSTMFYGTKEQQLPFTDSDGLYDFPSSDCKLGSLDPQLSRKTSLKRRDRKLSVSRSGTSPTQHTAQIEVHQPPPSALHTLSVASLPRRSPKRRAVVRQPETSSSSSESIAAAVDSPLNRNNKKKGFSNHLVYDASSTSVPDYVNTMFSEDDLHVADVQEMVPKAARTNGTVIQLNRPNRRISRLRAIGNQLRFLRRFDPQASVAKNRAPSTSGAPAAPSFAQRTQSSERYPNDEVTRHDIDNDDDDDDADVDISFVTSPLLFTPSSQKSTVDSASAAKGGYQQQQQQRPANACGATPKPWRSRDRRFVYEGSVNSD